MLHPDSGFFLIFQVNTRERYREGENISLKKIPPPGEAESKRKPKCDRNAAAGFPSACSSSYQEVLGYLPRTRLR
jgi:hypothetical protein